MRYSYENTAAIGKPIRVFVNGLEVDTATVADTEKGEVIYYPKPLRPHKNKKDQPYTRILRGHVTVEEIPNDH